jgi:hypothetical protein
MTLRLVAAAFDPLSYIAFESIAALPKGSFAEVISKLIASWGQ